MSTPGIEMYAPSPDTSSSSGSGGSEDSSPNGTLTPTGQAHVVTLPVLTPASFYNPSVDVPKGNGSLCRNCGVSGPVKSSRCFPDSDKEHRFYFPGDKDDDAEVKPKKLRAIWKVFLVLVLLASYGVSIAYIVIPIQKYLNQDVSTSVTVLSATVEKPIPFPALQVCNFNNFYSIEQFRAYYVDRTKDPKAEPQAFNFTVAPILTNDYGYDDFNCFEVNNVERSKGLQILSKRQKIILVVKVPSPTAWVLRNDDCFPELCDPDQDENATIYDIDPRKDGQGISLSAFAPDGRTRTVILDDVSYVNTGAYSQISLEYSRTFRFGKSDPEEGYTISSSSVRYVPNSYAINFTKDGDSFAMDDVVFAEIGFGELSFTEVNETKPYEAFNAFGDATAIMGFFTGFGFFGGPTFLPLIMDNSHRSCWSSLFYS